VFQFLGRNSGRSDPRRHALRQEPDRFQFLGRNSGRSDLYRDKGHAPSTERFQFLGRNSGRSDHLALGLHAYQSRRFNSSVGILVVRTSVYAPRLPFPRYQVSIPRSEFWSFGRQSRLASSSKSWAFQFLGRNSGRSDHLKHGAHLVGVEVSIPRSEFWSFGLIGVRQTNSSRFVVSIPRSEFWSFGRLPVVRSGRAAVRFNSSVGILVVRTSSPSHDLTTVDHVSIPRSEFWSFGPSSPRAVATR